MKVSRILPAIILTTALMTSCTPPEAITESSSYEPDYVTSIANLHAADLNGRVLQVVATTNLVTDVAAHIGGDAIQLTGLIPTNADPHSYTPTPQDLRAVADADLILISGYGLEEGLGDTLQSVAGDVPIISLSEGVTVRAFSFDIAHAEQDEELSVSEESEHEDHDHAGVDPHVWFDPTNVMIWAENAASALEILDPANEAVYAENRDAYSAELETLDAWIRDQVDLLPAQDRQLVTDHGAFGYFADRYGFEVVGAVIPAYSTTASPSPQDITTLLEAIQAFDVQAVFVGMTVNPTMAERVAEDSDVVLIPLYTGSLSEETGPATTYIEMMHYDVSAIVNGLQGE